MQPEVKLIYSSMLTRNKYNNKPVPKYILKIVDKYVDVLDLEKTELENIQLLLEAVIEGTKCEKTKKM